MPGKRRIVEAFEEWRKRVLRESTSSTDRLLSTSNGSAATIAPANATTIGAHVLHSIPPRATQCQKPRRPYQPTTTTATAPSSGSKHLGRYDKVPTREVNSTYDSGEDNEDETQDQRGRRRSSSSRSYTLKPSNGKMVVGGGGDANQSQCQENMKRIFTTEEQMRPLKDVASIQVPDEEEGETKIQLFRQIIAAISVSLASMVVGFDTAYTSPATDSMKALQVDYFPVSEQSISWIGGIMPLAALLGGILGGQLIDWRGRRNTILMTAPFFFASSLLIALAENVSMILIGRAVEGICVGILSLSLPVYLGETLRPEVRGTLGLLPTALGNTGILVCFLAGKYLNWWELAILGAVIPIPFFILMFIIPETPRWHMTKGNIESARRALQWLRGKSAEIRKEFQEIENSIAESNKQQGSESKIKNLLSPSCLKPLAILIGLMFFQQMSGINAVIFYTVTIFKDAGSTIDEKLCTIIVGIVNFMSTFLATTLIDRLGRKILLYISAVSMIVTLSALGTFFYYKNTGYDMTEYGWLPLASFVIYVIGFSLGFGPVPWLMMGEILPSAARGSAASITTAFNWFCTFIVTKTFKDIIENLGNHGAFWMFGVICAASLFFVYFLVPETRGKSLEDIERKFTSKKRNQSGAV